MPTTVTLRAIPTISPTHSVSSEHNQLRKLAQLIGEIYSLFSQMSQKDRKDIVDIKARYNIATLNGADATRKQGNVGVIAASATLVMFVFSVAIGGNKTDQAFLALIQQGPDKVGNLISSRYTAEGNIQSGISQIEHQDLQEKGNRSQSEGSAKQELAGVLQAYTQLLRAASATSG